MKAAHSVEIRVFCSEGENEAEVISGIKALLPFNLEEEKTAIKRQGALGFSDRKITIFEIILTKNRHIGLFLGALLPKISDTDRQMLLRQLESRVDDEGAFFIRLEKEQLSKTGHVLVTDGGNCYHIKIKPAVYPSTKERAVAIVRQMLEDRVLEILRKARLGNKDWEEIKREREER